METPGNWMERKNQNYQTGDDEEVITTHHLENEGIAGGDSDGFVQSGHLARTRVQRRLHEGSQRDRARSCLPQRALEAQATHQRESTLAFSYLLLSSFLLI